MSSRRAILVGCGNAKQDTDEPVPAKELYTSGYFTKKMGAAEALDGDVFIISAKYGAIEPEQDVEWYDMSLNDLTFEELASWRSEVINTLETYEEYVLFMGEDYREQVKISVEGKFISPFEGTSGIGDQMGLLDDIKEDGLN